MDFVPLIDAVGEPATLALTGLALGMAFGVFAQTTGFCARSAVIDVVRNRDGKSLALWLVAFATAILGTQLLVANEAIALDETRFFATAQSLSGAIVGGLLFGIGMTLTRGCTSRLLVLASGGNLRAVASVSIIAAIAWATIQGPLVPIRDAVGSLLSTNAVGTNDVATLVGFSNVGIVAGVLLVALALVSIVKAKLPAGKLVQGLAIGALIPAGWWLTWQLSTQVFDPIQAESLSYMRPLATTINFGASGGAADYLGLDTGLIGGTILGAFFAALATRSFKIRTFSEAGTPHPVRYIIGSVLMGFGGILAVGCTIGAGFTGGSVLALSSLLGLSAMLISAGVTDLVLDAPKQARDPSPLAFPAE